MGLQDDISWKQVGMAAVGAGVTAGIGGYVGGVQGGLAGKISPSFASSLGTDGALRLQRGGIQPCDTRHRQAYRLAGTLQLEERRHLGCRWHRSPAA